MSYMQIHPTNLIKRKMLPSVRLLLALTIALTSHLTGEVYAQDAKAAQDAEVPAASADETPTPDAVLDDEASNSKPSPVAQANALSMAFRAAAEAVGPAVVTVVGQEDEIETYTENFQSFEKITSKDSSIGSGVIIHDSGIVMTNSHVLEDTDRVLIRMADGREFVAYDIRRDPKSDVAIMRMRKPPKVKSAKLGDSDQVEVGDWVLAIGNPFEFDTTVSAGIISGKNRMLEKIERGKLLQTDAMINPGNSGGPLVNLDGKVIGINTAIASNNGGYQGVGFAIPVNYARWVVNQLAKNGKVRRTYIGVTLKEFTPREATKRNLPPMAGVYVENIVAETPADLAGLRLNDVIIEFAGMRIRDKRDLQGAVEQKPMGSKHPIKIIRNGKTKQLDIVLDMAK